MKETNASLLYECNCQCYILRFEERAKEFILMAKVNFIKGNHSESNERAIIYNNETQRIQVRGVIGIRPEAGRSRRGQVEA